MKESRKEFIKDLHSVVGNVWKTTIEKEFPKLFKEDPLEAGKWYKSEIATFKVTSVAPLRSYGIYSGKWANDNFTEVTTRIRPATGKEVKKALIKEAKRLGVKTGAKVKCLMSSQIATVQEMKFTISEHSSDFWVKQEENGVWCLLNEEGAWATVVETITKEQAEKELGKTILN